jgi:hypothetical protein
VTGREERLAALVGAVVERCLVDRGASRVALLDDGGPEAALAARLLGTTLPADAIVRVTTTRGEVESVLHDAGAAESDCVDAGRAEDEVRRMRARLIADAVVANPANKTALLLGGELPPDPLFPLGDLWASDVAALAGDWSAPDGVRRLVDEAGSVEVLDAALRRLLDRRDPRGLDALPGSAAGAVREALARGRASRLHPRVVPKLGPRTLGVDLFE